MLGKAQKLALCVSLEEFKAHHRSFSPCPLSGNPGEVKGYPPPPFWGLSTSDIWVLVTPQPTQSHEAVIRTPWCPADSRGRGRCSQGVRGEGHPRQGYHCVRRPGGGEHAQQVAKRRSERQEHRGSQRERARPGCREEGLCRKEPAALDECSRLNMEPPQGSRGRHVYSLGPPSHDRAILPHSWMKLATLKPLLPP